MNKTAFERSVDKIKLYGSLIVPIIFIWGIQPALQGLTIEKLTEGWTMKTIGTLAYILLFNYIYFDIRINDLKEEIKKMGKQKGITDIVIFVVFILIVIIAILLYLSFSGIRYPV